MTTASIGVCSLLVLSRDALPTESLAENWWLYRLALVFGSASALLAFLVFILSYRERFYWSRFDDKVDEWRDGTRFRQAYAWFTGRRRPFELGSFWLAMALSPMAFFLTILASGALLLRCLWSP